jgi:gas vesicle protein
MSDNRINNLGWFLAGLGIGTVAGIFYATKSGEEMRADIRGGVDQGRDFLAARGREVSKTVTSWVDRGKDAAEDARKQIGSVADRGKRAVGRQKENISSAIDAGRDAIHKATSD